MKKILSKLLIALAFAAPVFAVSSSASACDSCRYHHGYYHHNYRHCFWVGGHWRHGVWVPRHRVCRY